MSADKILIIDDDPDVLLTARMLLEQLEFDVSVLSDPEKIQIRLEREPFDVILLDMNFRRGNTSPSLSVSVLLPGTPQPAVSPAVTAASDFKNVLLDEFFMIYFI